MLICDGDNRVQIVFKEGIPRDLPGAGDAQLHVTVASSGFCGEADVWIEEPELQRFLQSAAEFERGRQGTIEIESMSPDLFRLRIFSVDRKGHLAVSGRLGTMRRGNEGGFHTSAIEFEFDFDPSQLVPFVHELRRILESAA